MIKFIAAGYITGHGCGHIAVRSLPLHQATRVSRTDEDSYQKDDHRGAINISYIYYTIFLHSLLSFVDDHPAALSKIGLHFQTFYCPHSS